MDMTMGRNVIVRIGMVLLVVLLCIQGEFTDQDLGETYCPVCNMVVQSNPKQLLRGNQALYACEMAGHLQQLVSNPKSFVRGVSALSSIPEPYKNSTLSCPICHDKHITHAIDFGPHGNQKIFACSEHHATSIMDNPGDIFIYKPENDTSVYCEGATIMYDGFQSAYHGICPRMLFHSAILNSQAKYALGFISIVLMGLLLEYWVEFHNRLHRKLLKTSSLPMVEKEINEAYDNDEFYSLEDKLLPHGTPTQRQVMGFSSKLLLTSSYMGMMVLAYFIMLIVMSYESGFFCAAILGLGLGFFFFRDVEQVNAMGNPDPCCST